MQENEKVFKTTIELDQDLREPVMLHVTRTKIRNRKYSTKQFINEAVREKLDREKGA